MARSPASSSTIPHPRRPRPLLSRSTLMRGWMPRGRLAARGQGMARRSIYGPEPRSVLEGDRRLRPCLPRTFRRWRTCPCLPRASDLRAGPRTAFVVVTTLATGVRAHPPPPTMEWPRLRSATFAAPGPRSRREASPSPRSPLGSVGTGSHAPAPGFSDAGCEPESRTQPAAVVYSLL